MLIATKHPFVAVDADHQLGGNVAEQGEDAGGIDESAGAVGAAWSHAETERDGDAFCVRHGAGR